MVAVQSRGVDLDIVQVLTGNTVAQGHGDGIPRDVGEVGGVFIQPADAAAGQHHRPRILFHEDITGHEITQTLLNEVLRCENIELREHTTLLDFFADASACGGVIAAGPDGEPRAIGAGAVVLAGNILDRKSVV